MAAPVAALIVAAGRGQRFGGAVAKQYAMLGGEPMLRRTVRLFLDHPHIATVLVVIHPDDAERYRKAVAGLRLAGPALGGATRGDSVLAGLEWLAAMPEGPPARVLIHDAARPLTPRAVVDRVLLALDRAPGAIAALPLVDSLHRCGADGAILETVSRQGLWRAQTPQGFHFAEILAAHRAAAGMEHTDDAAVAVGAGLAVTVLPGAEESLKMTTREDLARAASATMPGDAPASPVSPVAEEYRTGLGFDVHRFGPHPAGSVPQIMLAGVAVPHDLALLGHSDADVALHALTDALLGALGGGDIGGHFPPGDEQWRGASSDRFLAHAAALLRQAGGRITHVDITLICERPKIGPHRTRMIARIAGILAVAEGRVSVKATTTEGLGFTGRGEGIAAQAVATIALPRPPDSGSQSPRLPSPCRSSSS